MSLGAGFDEHLMSTPQCLDSRGEMKGWVGGGGWGGGCCEGNERARQTNERHDLQSSLIVDVPSGFILNDSSVTRQDRGNVVRRERTGWDGGEGGGGLGDFHERDPMFTVLHQAK